ncbi:MAG: hypothetical protein KAS12_04050 [Candidatus Aenigmarchaeota archaeon]|nr:hypothetical protein [Candidatus Aenigmarchaeota archaeon]
MATGGVYSLITHDGEKDKKFIARDILIKHLNHVKMERTKRALNIFKKKNQSFTQKELDFLITPTISDLTATHTFFKATEFKPFIPIMSDYRKIISNSGNTIGQVNTKLQFTMERLGDFVNDGVIHIKLPAIGNANGSVRYKYCDYPGMRLCSEVKLNIDGIIADTYTSDDYIMYKNFEVEDISGLSRSVGHSTPIRAKFYDPEKQLDEIREVLVGYQTKKIIQPELDLWIPLIFWFNKSPEEALPTLRMETLQKYIEIHTAKITDIIKAYDLADNEIPLPFSEIIMKKCELYLNNLHVMPEVVDIYQKNLSSNVVRQFKRSQAIQSRATGEKSILADLSAAIEYMYIGFRPVSNLDDFEAWHKFMLITPNTFLIPVMIKNGVNPPFLVWRDMIYKTESLPVDNFSLKVDNSYFFEDSSFHLVDQHIPQIGYMHGNTTTPEDQGIALISFTHKTNNINPTGYLNASRLREFIFSWKDTNITPSTPVELFISAKTLNVLLLDGKTAIMKFIS